MKAESQPRKGLWTKEEDRILVEYINVHGRGNWNRIPKVTGLKRCGKSCRLRWLNYLNPNVKHGEFSAEEEDLIIRLHNLLGNRWSLIAGRVPGRTDNQVKNHWNTHLCKKLGLKKQVRKSMSSSKIRTAKNLELDEEIHIQPRESTQLPQNIEVPFSSFGWSSINNQEAQFSPHYEADSSALETMFYIDQFNLNSPGNIFQMNTHLT